MKITSTTTVPVFFSKFFSEKDTQDVLAVMPEGSRRVLFVDTTATPNLVAAIKELQQKGIEVVYVDHHYPESPQNSREIEIAAATRKVVQLVGASAIISSRERAPACSQLIRPGEYAGVDVIMDPDPDGLTAAMKALGILYPELDSDAAVLDNPCAEQTEERLSSLAALLVRGLVTLPPFNPKKPKVFEEAKGALFTYFVTAVQGNGKARVDLETKISEKEVLHLLLKNPQQARGSWAYQAPGCPGPLGGCDFGSGTHVPGCPMR